MPFRPLPDGSTTATIAVGAAAPTMRDSSESPSRLRDSIFSKPTLRRIARRLGAAVFIQFKLISP